MSNGTDVTTHRGGVYQSKDSFQSRYSCLDFASEEEKKKVAAHVILIWKWWESSHKLIAVILDWTDCMYILTKKEYPV